MYPHPSTEEVRLRLGAGTKRALTKGLKTLKKGRGCVCFHEDEAEVTLDLRTLWPFLCHMQLCRFTTVPKDQRVR